MHPDSQSLEAAFEAAQAGSPQRSSRTSSDPVVEEFNAFFEKLSSLDQLQWSADGAVTGSASESGAVARTPKPPAKPTTGSAAGAPMSAAARRKAALRKRAAATAAAANVVAEKPKMTIMTSSGNLDGTAQAEGESLTYADVDAVVRGKGSGKGGMAKDIARFLKMTMVGLMLFALGLGAGWAALSLPGHMNDVMPNVSRLMERARAITPIPQMGLRTGGNTGDAVETTRSPALPATPERAGGVELGQDGRTASPQARAAQAERASAVANANTVEAAQLPATVAEMERGMQLPTAPEGQVTDVGQADEASVAAPVKPARRTATTGGARFALQVGACTSTACVQNYRRMLLQRVGAESIQVVTQPRADGAAIQRIRVEPLGRAAGEQLKADLAAQDPRFTDAYLISLR